MSELVVKQKIGSDSVVPDVLAGKEDTTDQKSLGFSGHALDDQYTGIHRKGSGSDKKVSALSPEWIKRNGAKASFAAAFTRILGPGAIEELIKAFSDKPVVLIAGDQLTGKSTVAGIIAKKLGGETASTGSLVRKMAKERGLTPGEMSKALAAEPQSDVTIDFGAAKLIAGGEAVVVESRLAGHLGQFLRRLGRESLFSVYLACGARERALRYVGREISPEARTRVEPKLEVPESADLAACLEALRQIDDPAVRQAADTIGRAAARDDDDRKRLNALYGIDYGDKGAFDLVVDTSRILPDQVAETILAAIAARSRP